MLVDKLGMPVAPQEHTEIVKPSDNALEFDPVYKKYRKGGLVLANMIEKCVLQILYAVRHCSLVCSIFLRRGRFAVSLNIRPV